MKTALIFGAGEQNISHIPLPKNCLVWAADGGLSYCEKCGIKPDFIIGDFDSLGYIPENATVLPVQKDVTDMEAAIQNALAMGCGRFLLYGGTGNRLDHTLGNISLLISLANRGREAWLLDKNYAVTAVTNGALCFDETERGTVSVFAAGKQAHGVSLTGLLYELQNATLTNAVTLGVSNEFTGRKSEIRVEDGTLVVVKNCKVDW